MVFKCLKNLKKCGLDIFVLSEWYVDQLRYFF